MVPPLGYDFSSAGATGAQAKRSGPLSRGGKKRCQKGKSCGSSCINKTKLCLIETSLSVRLEMNRVRSLIQTSTQPTLSDEEKEWNKQYFKKVFERLRDLDKRDVSVINGDYNEGGVKWSSVLNDKVNFIGEGAFGQFATVPAEDLVKGGGKKYPGGVGVKVGEIGSQEVEAIRRSGELGVGPRLIAARVSKINREDSDYPEGAIAMSKVPGRRLREIPGGIEGGTSGRAVMEAVSLLHKTGVSHNDLHDGNIFVDKDGKVHLVDFGMARISPKYALAEAMRQFGSQGNLEDVRQRLLALGVTKREASRMQVSFGDYVSGGGWDKISDKQAMSLINTFYREAI